MYNNYPYKTRAYTYTQTAKVDALAVSLAEVKLWLDVTVSTDDALITSLIKTAEKCFEDYTGRILITTTFKTFRDFWGAGYELMKSPLQSLSSVKYYDEDNNLQTLDSGCPQSLHHLLS